MKVIIIRLHPFSDTSAYETADALRDAGEISYEEGNDIVAASIAEITVEDVKDDGGQQEGGAGTGTRAGI